MDTEEDFFWINLYDHNTMINYMLYAVIHLFANSLSTTLIIRYVLVELHIHQIDVVHT